MLQPFDVAESEGEGVAIYRVKRSGVSTLHKKAKLVSALPLGAVIVAASGIVRADAGHGHDEKKEGQRVEKLIEEHKGHSHGHDFDVMEKMSPEQIGRLMHEMEEIGLAISPMDSHEGRELFVSKGCVVCHQVNGVGGVVGPSLNAADMPSPMNAFEFAARMWRGAPAMAQMQESMLGEMISLDGRELADLIAFAHDEQEQRELSLDQGPERFRELMVK